MQSRTTIRLVFLGLMHIPALVGAQDSHYWTNQYGTRANLLNGLVVGGVKDLSATYYNPGAMALGKEAKLAISTDAFEFARIKVENGAGRGVDLKETRGGTAPKIFTLRLSNAHIVDGDELAIAVVTRHDFKFKTDTETFGDRDVFPGTGLDHFAGDIALDSQLYESWWGFTWAKRPSGRNYSVGVSTFLAYRDQSARAQIVAQAVSADSTGAAIILWDDYRYNNFRAIWKIGALFGSERATWGLAVTTPGWDFGGSGVSKLNAARIAVPDSSGAQYSLLETTAQRGLSTDYRSPLSVALGGRLDLGKTEVWSTVEWFDAVRRYKVLDAQEFVGQTTGRLVSADVYGAASSVLNAGIGIEHEFNSSSLFAAFNTDFSYTNPDDGLSLTSWDIYHTTVGGAVKFGNFDFTGGLSLGLGKRESNALVDLSNPDGGIAPDEDDRLVIHYRRLKMVFGFSVEL